jgi:tyrosyl-tRNA synthetase
MDLVKDLKERGLVEHTSAPLEKIFEKKRIVYFGVDPSSDSMQAGNLSGILLAKRIADAGHKIILLVGGGTGMIGDPREKGERQLQDIKVIEKNKKAIRAQMQTIIGSRVTLVDNADWLLKIRLFEFLRDTGKYFTVNELVKRDIIKRRLETPDESISYTEFTYALLQAYDFMTLFEKYGCEVQFGGTDQWTNLISGVDLIHKKLAKDAYAFTNPLVTDANGKKFGKSEGNAVWLDPNKTSPFAFYQFWLNQPDEEVGKLLKFYTFMSVLEIDALVELHSRNPGRREAQRLLARHVTESVHGKSAAANAAAVSDVLFASRNLTDLSPAEQSTLLKEAPSVRISKASIEAGYSVVDALLEGSLATSKTDARRLIEGKGVYLNDEVVEHTDALVTAFHFFNNLALLRRGKQVLVLTIEK